MIKRIFTLLSILTLLVGIGKAGETPRAKGEDKPNPVVADSSLPPQDNEVIIYSSKNCYWCTAVEKTFREKNIPFTVINVDNNPVKFKELQEKTGKETVPQVLINGKHVGSYLDIVWGDVDTLLQRQPETVNK